MTTAPWAPELATARRLAYEAGHLVKRLRQRGVGHHLKSDHTPVTEADLASDHLLRIGLSEAFPQDAILTEEAGRLGPPGARRTWLVDPIDGTRGFMDGSRGYAVQIALALDDAIVLGVVYDPERERVYQAVSDVATATDGDGAQTPLRVPTAHASRPRLLTSTRVPAETRAWLLEVLGADDAGVAHSVGIKVAMLLEGHADVYVSDTPVSYWDSGAPWTILRAAGGQVTDWRGSELSFHIQTGATAHDGPFIASVRDDHRALCDPLSRGPAAPRG